jgi:hypothetical protein
MSLIIVDDVDEPFTQSQCSCDFCRETHMAVAEWNFLVPKTPLQRGMKNVIAKIENDARNPKNPKKKNKKRKLLS